MKASTLLIITLVLFSIVHTGAGNQKNLLVRQPLFIKANVGDSVTISCFFETLSPSFTVKWTLCCNQMTSFLEHQNYKGRVTLSSTFQDITIANVSEQDSEKYCCEVLTADGETGVGNGTLLEVARVIEKEEYFSTTICIVIEVVRMAFLTVIIILLSVIIKKLP
ncbi:uncharacterized protein ACNLHF_000272 [Anomaloglossus baeobatrachus]